MVIEDIPTDTFNQIVDDLRQDGWVTVSEYDGMDAWIDYGRIVLQKGKESLIFEWTNWFEGSVEGTAESLRPLREKYELWR